MDIKYRNGSADDFNGVIEIIVSSMDFSVFTKATDKDVIRSMAAVSLAKDFHTADYIRIAECNEKVCGFLIGATNVVSTPALSFESESIIKKAKEKLSKSEEGRMVLAEMKQNDEKEKSAPKSTATSDCDGELVFFAIDEKYRRYKIGSTLIESFEEYLKECGAKKYFLYTDSQCTYQYYEKNGYERVERKQSAFNPSVENYTYIKEF
jgi:ribosomal protein S18 acetylase RimI-like enzyme